VEPAEICDTTPSRRGNCMRVLPAWVRGRRAMQSLAQPRDAVAALSDPGLYRGPRQTGPRGESAGAMETPASSRSSQAGLQSGARIASRSLRPR
jgi:hypothetical protein